nr:MAG TPA: hypothetical protein [Caudoviricetes sp.]
MSVGYKLPDGRCIHHLRYSIGVCREPFPTLTKYRRVIFFSPSLTGNISI